HERLLRNVQFCDQACFRRRERRRAITRPAMVSDVGSGVAAPYVTLSTPKKPVLPPSHDSADSRRFIKTNERERLAANHGVQYQRGAIQQIVGCIKYAHLER